MLSNAAYDDPDGQSQYPEPPQAQTAFTPSAPLEDFPPSVDNPPFTTPEFPVNDYLPEPPGSAPGGPMSTGYDGEFSTPCMSMD